MYNEMKAKRHLTKGRSGVFFALYEELPMKAIRCDLPYAETIEIHPMADLHIGDNNSDYKLILERIEHIRNTGNAYCI